MVKSLGCGTSPALGELSLELSSHSLNGDIWLVTRMWNQSSIGGLSLELSGHSLNGGTCSVNRNMTQSITGGLSLRLRAILQENGGAWSVTKCLTLGQIMQLMADALGLLQRCHNKPQTESRHVRHFDPRSVGFEIFSKA